MPSSSRRKKAALRDSELTRAFFDQASPQASPGASSGCPGQCQSEGHAADPAESDPDVVVLRHGMSFLWEKKYKSLTAEEREEVQLALEHQPAIAEAHSRLRELKLAHKQMKDDPAERHEIPRMETFDLDNLDEVAEQYDGLCELVKDGEEREMARLAELVSNSASIASDTTRSKEERLAAELNIHTFNAQSKLTLPLTSCLRQVQLFNVEKRFGFVEESYHALGIADRKRRGEAVPTELPPSFRQKLNNPFKPTESAPKPRQEKGRKKLSGLEALAELQLNVKLAIEEIQDVGKDTSDTEDFEDFPSLAPSIMYAGVPIPEDIPVKVRQHFSDGDFAFQALLVLHDDASKQLLDVRSAFVAWHSAGHEVWEAGKNRIHEMPLVREYEYTRISFYATLSVASRQEVKIVEFYSGKGAPKLSQAMKDVFGLQSMSLEEFEKDWVRKSGGDAL